MLYRPLIGSNAFKWHSHFLRIVVAAVAAVAAVAVVAVVAVAVVLVALLLPLLLCLVPFYSCLQPTSLLWQTCCFCVVSVS